MAKFISDDQGTWFYFDAADQSQGGVRLRLMTPIEEDQVDRKAITVKRKPLRGMMVEDRQDNVKLRSQLCYDLWICDWKNVELDGVSLPCTKENKLKMMNVPLFARFVLEKIGDLGDSTDYLDEATVKNSQTSSSGNVKA